MTSKTTPPVTKPSPRTKTEATPAKQSAKTAKTAKTADATPLDAASTAERVPRAARPRPLTKTASAPAAKPRRARTTTKAAQPEAPVASAPVGLPELELPAGPAPLEEPTHEQMIRARAYELYERNGCVDGRELEDWLAAEAEVGALMTEDRTRLAA